MNTIIRSSIVVGTALGSSLAHATYQFELAYGDVAFATLNSTTVGSVLNPASVNIPASNNNGGVFKVQVLVKNTSSTSQDYRAGGFMLGLDRAVTKDVTWTTHAGFQAAQTDFFMDSTGGAVNLATNLNGFDEWGNSSGVDVTKLAGNLWGSAPGAGTTLRPIGLWTPFAFGAGYGMRLAPGQQVRLFDVSLTCLASGGSYGGFGILDYPGATRHTSILARDGDNSVFYQMHAVPVPEPTTAISLLVAAAFVAKRRKRNLPKLAQSVACLAFLGFVGSAKAGTVTAQLDPNAGIGGLLFGLTTLGQTAQVYCYTPNTNSLVGTFSGTIDTLGVMTCTVPNGTYDLHVKPATILTEKFPNQTVSGTLSLGTLLTYSGDCDNDDAVTIFDYIMISRAFDAQGGDARYTEGADLDQDGYVTVFDYILMSDNFDRIGSRYYGN